MKILLFFVLFLNGVCGDPDDINSVFVMEGENVTLPIVTDIQTNDLIVWTFGLQNTRIAQINKASSTICEDVRCEGADERFKDRLKLDNRTGSLTISDIRTQHSGLYTIENYRTEKFSKSFKVMVYARLPVPLITGDSSQCSSSESSSVSKCSVLCSVLNVSHVSLSWYKGSSLLSSISVSDLNIRLSLPLEVDYEDTNTHMCVLNNTITNHTQHLHITEVCQCSGLSIGVKAVIAIVLVFVVLGPFALGILWWKCSQAKKEDTTDNGPGEERVPLNGTCYHEKSVVKRVEVDEGKSVTLNTGETEIQGSKVVWWFGEAINTTSSCIVITKLNAQSEEDKGVNKRFKDKLQLDPRTGNLTITDIRTTDSGLYKLQISNNKMKLFIVNVHEETKIVIVTEGDPVTLATEVTELRKRDVIQWKFRDTLLAKITKRCVTLQDNGSFKDRLGLDKRTGELTIKNIQIEHAGLYQLQIQSTQASSFKRFSVFVGPSTASRSKTI